METVATLQDAKKWLTWEEYAVFCCTMHLHTAVDIPGILGYCGAFKVFLASAPASLLTSLSITDVLDEDTGKGYQRPYNKWHSLDFRRYIVQPSASTIPLVFNLRPEFRKRWRLLHHQGGPPILRLHRGQPCLAVVDGQHRLGQLSDLTVPLAFMAYIGLDVRSEMSLFSTINSKSRGLASSLTDYLYSSLTDDLLQEAPHLLLARRLNEDPSSPWFKLIRYGGTSTSSPHRRVSLRMMQKSIGRFLKKIRGAGAKPVDDCYRVILAFWTAVRDTFPDEWQDPRRHILTKGLGLYSLMLLLTDLAESRQFSELTQLEFYRLLEPLRTGIDWGSRGTFAQAGGHKGAVQVYLTLKEKIFDARSSR